MRRLLESLGLRRRTSAWADAGKHTVYVTSSLDGARQPCLFLPARTNGPRPLLVYLHPWRHGYDFDAQEWREEAKARDWHLIAPHFRGPNRTPKSCASRHARQDVLDAVNFACERVAVDPDRIYLGGVSGGAHMALAMAAHAPERWAAVSAWSPVSDLAAFFDECVATDAKAYRHIVKICGGKPGSSARVDEDLKYRSPRFDLWKAKGLPLDINHGIRDGQPRGVGIQHSVWAYNAIAGAEEDGKVADEEFARLQRLDGIQATDHDAAYGRTIYLRRYSGAARITLFEGGHEDLPSAACGWLADQSRR